jgi:hypothetical protein
VVVVDPLVRVPDDEHIVRSFRHGSTEQPPLRRVQVLRLVDDYMPVGLGQVRRVDVHRLLAEDSVD